MRDGGDQEDVQCGTFNYLQLWGVGNGDTRACHESTLFTYWMYRVRLAFAE